MTWNQASDGNYTGGIMTAWSMNAIQCPDLASDTDTPAETRRARQRRGCGAPLPYDPPLILAGAICHQAATRKDMT